MTAPTPDGDARALAAEIEIYRKARRLTPAEASRQIGCSTSQMSRWRRGGGISMFWLEKVATWMRRPLAELLPLAGYPAVGALIASSADEPTDNGFRAVKAAWLHLPEHRREVIVELAVGMHEPQQQRPDWPLGRSNGSRRVPNPERPARESRSVTSMQQRFGSHPVLRVLGVFGRLFVPGIFTSPLAAPLVRANAPA